MKSSAICEGVVIGFEQEKGAYRRNTMAPKIRFTCKQGLVHTFTSSVYSYPCRFSLGDMTKVIYPVDQPSKAEYTDHFAQWGMVLIPGVMAFAGLTVGLVMMRSSM